MLKRLHGSRKNNKAANIYVYHNTVPLHTLQLGLEEKKPEKYSRQKYYITVIQNVADAIKER